MTPLSPAYRIVLRIRTAFFALVPVIAVTVAAWLLLEENRSAAAAIAGAALLTATLAVLILPARRHRAWSYLGTEDELHVQRGIWFRSRTIVPFGRVQHIDVSQGPVERRYGVATLTLHTAGTLSSSVALPGLDIADAERMRDEIRGKIRLDLA